MTKIERLEALGEQVHHAQRDADRHAAADDRQGGGHHAAEDQQQDHEGQGQGVGLGRAQVPGRQVLKVGVHGRVAGHVRLQRAPVDRRPYARHLRLYLVERRGEDELRQARFAVPGNECPVARGGVGLHRLQPRERLPRDARQRQRLGPLELTAARRERGAREDDRTLAMPRCSRGCISTRARCAGALASVNPPPFSSGDNRSSRTRPPTKATTQTATIDRRADTRTCRWLRTRASSRVATFTARQTQSSRQGAGPCVGSFPGGHASPLTRTPP